jgi:histidine kinase
MTRRLATRLFLAFVLVVIAGSGVAFLVARAVAPGAFRRGLRLGAGRGRGPGAAVAPDVSTAFDGAIDTALWWGTVAAVIVGLALAWYISRRIVRPVAAVRDAARHMAAGDYGVRVPPADSEELADLGRDINALAAELHATEERRLRLLSELAHELRTPLTTIDGYVEGLLDGVFEPTPQTFAAIGEETSRLQRLSNDLSLVSRAEEGALDYQWEDLDVGDLVATTVERLRPQFTASEVALTMEQPTTPVVVRGDAVRLGQVATNLIGNALGHVAAGGQVGVAVAQRGQAAVLVVTDDGEGIAGEDLPRVFERFYRAAGTTRAGSGLGLTIARAIVRAHGGDVTAASDGPGRGATFTVTLPTALSRR